MELLSSCHRFCSADCNTCKLVEGNGAFGYHTVALDTKVKMYKQDDLFW